ncbi:lipoyl(octanoyl) transferase [Rhodothalassium salexigens DSM 2132]|uniref:Octanoyltransferase n=1 Tax=Rhodothalassium salexigens DSM 2132 TaxID=1188247 RepID=A0A4R2PFT7_RHOSA|nr:lipoyl(octanoyl) transferase LipB [Rhodothalassium salexigens]MBK1638185.1 lipoate-protein ligase B [Rhodothalassium salexigens DSM 2132]TCP33021.1 lipoyl(octanoyl) transferase [Rhodothalassium salexigens DSM 2132]
MASGCHRKTPASAPGDARGDRSGSAADSNSSPVSSPVPGRASDGNSAGQHRAGPDTPHPNAAEWPAWEVAEGLVDYAQALERMERRVAEIRAGTAPELIWLVEHPPLYTAGTRAKPADLLTPDRFPVYQTGRGGEYTYHGPGQRVVYVMIDLTRRGRDVRRFVAGLEAWIIAALARFNVTAEVRDGRVGVWVPRPAMGREDKIAAIGVRVRRWVSYHGLAINVDPDLAHFSGIVPCGLSAFGVTSLADLGYPVTLTDMDVALHETLPTLLTYTEKS